MSAVDRVVGGRAQRLIARAGITAWSMIGLVGVTAIVLLMLSAVSSVVLPLIFAAVLAVLFRPVAAWLESRGLRPTLAAGAVVIGCVVVVAVVVVLAVRGVLDQTAQIGGQVEEALAASGLDQETADDLQDAIESLSPVISEGVAKLVVGGIGRLAGFAAGAVLGVLIMYYLIKDGGSIRRSLVGSLAPVHRPAADELIGDAMHVLRKYGRGRTTLSALVAFAVGVASLLLGLPLVLTVVVVNFVGGYVPYIGAVVGGGLAISIALADGGVDDGTRDARRRPGSEPAAREPVRTQGDGPDARHPSPARADRHRCWRHRRRSGRSHPRRAVHGDHDARLQPSACRRRTAGVRRPSPTGSRDAAPLVRLGGRR
jgi:predicted PurR-regulated permease PerM